MCSFQKFLPGSQWYSACHVLIQRVGRVYLVHLHLHDENHLLFLKGAIHYVIIAMQCFQEKWCHRKKISEDV